MNTDPYCDWHGQWLSLHDLAKLMDKSYSNVNKMYQMGTFSWQGGICFLVIKRRVWARVDESVYGSLQPR